MFRRFSLALFGAVLVSAFTFGGATAASAAGPLTITTTSIPFATSTVPYSSALSASGGEAPYTWDQVDGVLAPGMTFSSAGVISGTYTGPEGNTWISGNHFRVTDSADPPSSVTVFLTFRVNPLPMRITTASVPNGAVGQPYSATIVATGGTAPYKFTKGGTLPKGLKLSKAGAITGTPKVGGSYTLLIDVKDASKVKKLAQRSIPLTITGAGSGSSPHGKPLITATGDVRCSGGLSFRVATAGGGSGFAVAGTYTGTLSCSGATGNAAVGVISAKVSGTFTRVGPCAISGVETPSPFSEIGLVWKASGGKMSSTSVRFTTDQASVTGWQLPAASPPGSSTVTGSYAGTGSATATITTSMAAITSKCGAPQQKFSVPTSMTINL